MGGTDAFVISNWRRSVKLGPRVGACRANSGVDHSSEELLIMLCLERARALLQSVINKKTPQCEAFVYPSLRCGRTAMVTRTADIDTRIVLRVLQADALRNGDSVCTEYGYLASLVISELLSCFGLTYESVRDLYGLPQDNSDAEGFLTCLDTKSLALISLKRTDVALTAIGDTLTKPRQGDGGLLSASCFTQTCDEERRKDDIFLALEGCAGTPGCCTAWTPLTLAAWECAVKLRAILQLLTQHKS